MTISDSVPDFPDEVPVADAVEQIRPAQRPVDFETVDADGRVPLGESDSAPLESSESDWQEQRRVVDGFDEDEFR